jgi:hypothetical protein
MLDSGAVPKSCTIDRPDPDRTFGIENSPAFRRILYAGAQSIRHGGKGSAVIRVRRP